MIGILKDVWNFKGCKNKNRKKMQDTFCKGWACHLFGDHSGILGGARQIIDGGDANLSAG